MLDHVLRAIRRQSVTLTPADLALAESHHILPSVHSPEQLPELLKQSFFWTNELRGLITAFAQAGIPMIPLKGPAFAERAYGAPHLRTCRDLDLLIQPSNLKSAEALLTELGFTPLAEADDYHRPWSRNTTAVELHHGIAIPHTFRFDLAGAWSRAEQGSFANTPNLQLTPEDELLYLCLHGARHRFDRLSIPLDIHHALARAIPGYTGTLPAAILHQAASQNLTGALLVGCGLAARLMETPFDAPAWIVPVIDDRWADLTSGPPVPWTTPDLYRFYLGLEPTPTARTRRRFAHLRVALTRLIPDDFAFAARFGIHNRPSVRVLRVFRLLFRYARR